MFGYMTDLATVDLTDICEVEAEGKELVFTILVASLIRGTDIASGHDLDSLLFNLMDEFLFVFSTEFIVSKQVSTYPLLQSMDERCLTT